MKFFLILFISLCFNSFSQGKLKISKLTAYHYCIKDSLGVWSSPIPCEINIVADSGEVIINREIPEYYMVATITENKDLSLKLDCLDINSLLVYIHITNDRGLIFLTVEDYNFSTMYYCKPSKDE